MSEDIGTAAEASRLLQDAKLFASLSESVRLRLASYAQEKLLVPGELLLREGDPAEEFFLIASGSVHVIGRAFDGTNLVMARLTRAQVFGEQALLQGGSQIRNASVRAAERCRVFVFPREALTEVQEVDETLTVKLGAIGDRQAVERRDLLREKVLQDIGLGAHYEIKRFEKDQIIFREGDPAGDVYLILDGTARVTRGDGDATILAELLPGQFFGELAILNHAPRAATVRATSTLETAALDGTWFRLAVAAQPRLQSIMASLQAMYLLPTRGLITLQCGALGPHPALTAIYHLTDGRRVVSTRITGLDAFSARIMGVPEATKSARFIGPGGILREIHVYRDQIVEIESQGAWAQLGAVFERLLDGSVIEGPEINAFEAAGDLNAAMVPYRAEDEVICRCSRVTAGDVVSMIAGGCNTLDKLAAKSMATRVCGGCIPAIKEFLGQGEWMPAVCDRTETHAPDIRMFRLRLLQGEAKPGIPGQHLVLQARIGGRWIERPYTISSASGTPGYYEIIVKREPQGLLSPWLFDSLEKSSALRVSPPRGTYYLDSNNTVDIVFFAGGIGITPALAMARTYAASPRNWRLHIDHSVSFEEQAICVRELRLLAARSAGITFNLRVTRPDGRLNASSIEALMETHPEGCFYLCGSPGYVESVEALLTQAGVARNQIHVELFTPIG